MACIGPTKGGGKGNGHHRWRICRGLCFGPNGRMVGSALIAWRLAGCSGRSRLPAAVV